MNRIMEDTARSTIGVPHTRGDEPGGTLNDIHGTDVFPTRVGMNRMILS